MVKHKALYLSSFGYTEGDSVPCEIQGPNCKGQATDIHHITARGRGGSNDKDYIENLQAVCRLCHDDYGDITMFKAMLYKIHKKWLDLKVVKYSSEIINNLINKYE